MKKLMIACAAVALAAGVQAASVQWSTGNMQYGSTYTSAKVNDQYNPQTYYLVWGASIDTVSAALAAGTTLDTLGQADGVLGSADTGTNTRGSIAKGNNTIVTLDTTLDLYKNVKVDGQTKYDFYGVILYDADGSGSDVKYQVTKVKSATLYDETDALAEKNGPVFAATDITTTTTAWSDYGVAPEPTSGLLLLVGVAGLALKRKRA